VKKRFGSAQEEEYSDWELAIKQTGITPKEKAIRTGLLFTAGLVAGEALMGVVIAVLIVLGVQLMLFETAPGGQGCSSSVHRSSAGIYPIREIISQKKE